MKLYQVPREDVQEADPDVSDSYRYVALHCETMVHHSEAKSLLGIGIAWGFGLGVAFAFALTALL